MSFVAPDFRAELRRFVHGYVGAHQGAILRAGDVFDLYARLMIDERVRGDSRTLVGLVLAYFVLPDDVMPEAELGPYGLLDDLYLAAHVYRMLRRQLPRDVLEDAWGEDDELEDVMDVVYSESRAAIGKTRKDVLEDAWGEDDELEGVMDVVYSESRAAIGKTRKDVLRVAGLD